MKCYRCTCNLYITCTTVGSTGTCILTKSSVYVIYCVQNFISKIWVHQHENKRGWNILTNTAISNCAQLDITRLQYKIIKNALL